MSYSVFIENDHVYVKYSGLVEGLDIVQLTADETFINNMRRLQKVIHDFSFCEDVSMGPEDMKEIALMSNLESNFSEKLQAVIIPKDEDGYKRVTALSQAIRSPDWNILFAQNYEEALTKF
jgi:hypothetical protein